MYVPRGLKTRLPQIGDHRPEFGVFDGSGGPRVGDARYYRHGQTWVVTPPSEAIGYRCIWVNVGGDPLNQWWWPWLPGDSLWEAIDDAWADMCGATRRAA